MTQKETRATVAELIGTFMLVLIGAGAVALSAGNVVAAALAHGLALVMIIATYGHISGAYVNPAVTLGALVGGKLELRTAGFYWAAQLLGAILAGIVLRIILPEVYTTTMGQTVPATNVTPGMLLVLEAILAFFLTSTVFQVAIYGRGGSLAPLLIGFALAACILLGGPLTGASVNPARTIGPAFLARETQDLQEVIFYIIATLIGGLIAGFVHSDFFAPDDGGDRAKKRR